ncbi:MAG: CPBP family intramembrane metalloprotease [Planctomycetes bacterium]|nr:CPBP family intramembrane metalloprotease [Planctomycetota bacterium]MCD7896224.1 CPBP family glutamic-type intramembrane protease [Planctomycetaceae bacterium]
MDTLDFDDTRGPGAYQLYMENSSAPLTGFLFALPLFLVYHAGLWWLNTFTGLRWANAIDIAIANGLGRLGMAGPLLSFIAVVIVFLTMHAMSGKSWHWPPAYTWLLMILESLVMALPVFLLSRLVVKLINVLPLNAALAQTVDMDGVGAADISWQANLVLSCGAGVYEEFFFRILVMGTLAFIFGKIFGMSRGWKFFLAAILQALVFSAFHHLPGGPEEIVTVDQFYAHLPVFTFRTLAGIYFAIIYIERGFGIAAGSHAGYDLMIVLLEMFAPLDLAAS